MGLLETLGGFHLYRRSKLPSLFMKNTSAASCMAMRLYVSLISTSSPAACLYLRLRTTRALPSLPSPNW